MKKEEPKRSSFHTFVMLEFSSGVFRFGEWVDKGVMGVGGAVVRCSAKDDGVVENVAGAVVRCSAKDAGVVGNNDEEDADSDEEVVGG